VNTGVEPFLDQTILNHVFGVVVAESTLHGTLPRRGPGLLDLLISHL
jgi:hypothetical protein